MWSIIIVKIEFKIIYLNKKYLQFTKFKKLNLFNQKLKFHD